MDRKLKDAARFLRMLVQRNGGVVTFTPNDFTESEGWTLVREDGPAYGEVTFRLVRKELHGEGAAGR